MDQFKDPVSHIYVMLALSLTQEVVCSNPFVVMTNIFENICKWFGGKLNLPAWLLLEFLIYKQITIFGVKYRSLNLH